MVKITGIGGLFFRAADPAAQMAWYETHFGINKVPDSYDVPCWTQDAGETVFAPFAKDTSYFGAPEQQWMINFRVEDLTSAISELEAAGINVEVDPEVYPNGTFARLADPEGNPIQLWQPA